MHLITQTVNNFRYLSNGILKWIYCLLSGYLVKENLHLFFFSKSEAYKNPSVKQYFGWYQRWFKESSVGGREKLALFLYLNYLSQTSQKMHPRKTKGWQGKMFLLLFLMLNPFNILCYRNTAPGQMVYSYSWQVLPNCWRHYISLCQSWLTTKQQNQ